MSCFCHDYIMPHINLYTYRFFGVKISYPSNTFNYAITLMLKHCWLFCGKKPFQTLLIPPLPHYFMQEKANFTPENSPLLPIQANFTPEKELCATAKPPSSEKKAKIIIDAREPPEYASFLQEFGILSEKKTLSIGDFILSSRTAAERKSRDDFEASIIDGRLFEQLFRLSASYERILLIVEGDALHSRLSRPALLGAYSCALCDFGASIFFTKNKRATAQLLSSIAKYEQISKKSPPRVHSRKKALTLQKTQQALIEALPNTGPAMAHALLSYFKTPAKVLGASKEELLLVPRMGEKKAQLIKNILESNYNCKNM